MTDPINPQHYRSHPSGVECISITEHMNFNIGNAVKYLWRADEKGDPIENLKKAAWYVNREIERRLAFQALHHRPRPQASEDNAPGRGAGGTGGETRHPLRGSLGEGTGEDAKGSLDQQWRRLYDECFLDPANKQSARFHDALRRGVEKLRERNINVSKHWSEWMPLDAAGVLASLGVSPNEDRQQDDVSSPLVPLRDSQAPQGD